MKKRLDELDVEELLKELETSPDVKQFRTDGVKGDFLEFCNAFDFRPGSDKIPLLVLRKIYKRWSKSPMSNRELGRKLRELFEVETENKFQISFNEAEFRLKREDWVYFYSSKPTKQRWDEANKQRHFQAFLDYFDIKPGDTPVNVESLHLLYSRYLNETKRKANYFSLIKLKSYLKLYFKETVTVKSSYYHVSDTIWNSLNREVYNEKEKDTKKRKKISITHSRNES